MIEKFLDNASDILLFGQDAVKEVEDPRQKTDALETSGTMIMVLGIVW